jgi:hypothetical protein
VCDRSVKNSMDFNLIKQINKTRFCFEIKCSLVVRAVMAGGRASRRARYRAFGRSGGLRSWPRPRPGANFRISAVTMKRVQRNEDVGRFGRTVRRILVVRCLARQVLNYVGKVLQYKMAKYRFTILRNISLTSLSLSSAHALASMRLQRLKISSSDVIPSA